MALPRHACRDIDKPVCCVCLVQNGQKYEPHHDYFSHKDRDNNGGNRMATVLVSPQRQPVQHKHAVDSGIDNAT